MVCSQLSKPEIVTSGVPQGSILGPLLYILYVNDLPTVVKTRTLMYADDIKLFTTVSNNEDAALLQRDIDNIVSWATTWNLRFNPCKTLHMTFTLKKQVLDSSYFINDTRISSVAHVKVTSISTVRPMHIKVLEGAGPTAERR